MPAPSVLETAEVEENNIPNTTSNEADTEAMTWQQQKDFGDLAVSEGGYPSHTRSLAPKCHRFASVLPAYNSRLLLPSSQSLHPHYHYPLPLTSRRSLSFIIALKLTDRTIEAEQAHHWSCQVEAIGSRDY
jgi:hypothetical protein